MADALELVAAELGVRPAQVRSTVELLDGGATVPFLARYRKEATGLLDEVQILAIRDRIAELRELDRRRETMLASLTERGLLTDGLSAALRGATSSTELEDLYLPFRQKRKTRASIARERGLQPLADALRAARVDPVRLAELTASLVDAEKGVENREAALAGARDIIAEEIAEDPDTRKELRSFAEQHATLRSKSVKSKEKEGAKYRDWFDWSEPLRKAPSHRVLAMLRGAREGYLRVHALPDDEEAIRRLARRHNRGAGFAGDQIQQAIVDAWGRLIGPSLENALLKEKKAEADRDAIRVFASNVRELLMEAPLGQEPVLAIDPGLRTGCKVVALGPQGDLLANETVFPHQGAARRAEAGASIKRLVERHGLRAVAIGNGTAGRETEAFVRELSLGVPVTLVNESGASIYSASAVAREEFPDHDITVRGSVSIGRRCQDPLAELVKLDPSSIGVGQYQHDVDQAALKSSLDDVVGSCVNAVGVDVNTASPNLLTYVAGLGPQLAKNIVQHRSDNGPFRRRRDLLKVPRLGAKAFEQCAGFLRIRGGAEPLDRSAVHPERYALVASMARDIDASVEALLQDAEIRRKIDVKRYVDGDVGEPTLRDILAELEKPGRDPRPSFESFQFGEVHSLGDLKPGMRLPGLVTNVTHFGAFVDIGVHEDGLVHISQLADRFVEDPREVVKVRQQVQVTVVSIDLERKRIALSMKSRPKVE